VGERDRARWKVLLCEVCIVLTLNAFRLTCCRNQAALVAFTLPQKWKAGAGLSIVATHVDSPNLKVRLLGHYK